MTPEDMQVNIKMSYNFDAFLMYLVQDVTKKPSAEILNFFYELANAVASMGFKAKKDNGGIDKRIDDCFPGSSIPFHMRIKGRRRTWDYVNGKYQTFDNPIYAAIVEVGFPTQNIHMDSKKLEDAATAIMEHHLLGGDVVAEVAPFDKPEPRSGRMYKKLMDEFAGRPTAEKKRGKKAEEESAE